MKNRNLSNNGLSLSQAQSISNLCFQRAVEITNQLELVNNFKKSIKIADNEYQTILAGHPMPKNVVEQLQEKAKLHACQAFLMENIKTKDLLLNEIKNATPIIDSVIKPEVPKYLNANENKQQKVDENYGWSQLTSKEYNEYLEAEAYASHIGQYIHKKSHLDRLRNELNNIPDVDWIELEKDKKTLVYIEKHHTSEELLGYHEKLAKLHREYEQKVNYYKAKVKNITTLKNAEIAKHNSEVETNAANINNKLASEYNTQIIEYENKLKEIRSSFEIERQNEISRIAALRIDVDPRFQEVIDMFLKDLNEE